ncbi:hypothetical protein G3I15_03140, partial [Streptomyces sp. SID10244]|nr:hypothetical protein [Streptomyces sp. SID10244]
PEATCGKLLPGLIDGEQVAGVGLDAALAVTPTTVSGDAGIVLGAPLADLILVVSDDDVLVFSPTEPGV